MTEQEIKPKPKNEKPPEPTFYDEPVNKANLKRMNSWFKKHWIFFLCLGVFFTVLILPMLFSSKDSLKPQRLMSGEEKRENVSRESMEQAIEQASVNKKASLKPIQRPVEQRGKRNYASDIAVYVYKDEKQLVGGGQQLRDLRKSESLGIPSGTRIPALLSNRIFSFNVEAPVIALIDHDFKLKDKVLIPKGAKFLGEASVVKSIDRINVSFDILIFPDGKEVRVRAMALSPDGAGGIKGKVQKHRDIKALKAIGETLLGGVSLFAGGARSAPFSMEDQLRLNLTQNLTNQAAQDLRSVRVDQSITAEAYTPIDVMILEKT